MLKLALFEKLLSTSPYKTAPYLWAIFRELGVSENVKIGKKPYYLKFWKVIKNKPLGWEHLPWCAVFMNWALNAVGMKGTNSPAAASFKNWGVKVTKPRLGDIMILHRGSQNWQRHVNVYICQSKNFILGVGGNQNDQVGFDLYSASKVDCFRRHENGRQAYKSTLLYFRHLLSVHKNQMAIKGPRKTNQGQEIKTVKAGRA